MPTYNWSWKGKETIRSTYFWRNAVCDLHSLDSKLYFTEYGSIVTVRASSFPVPPGCLGWSGFLTPLLCSVTFPPHCLEIIPSDICLITPRTSGNPAICWNVHRVSAAHLTVSLDASVWQTDARQLIRLLILTGVAQNITIPTFAHSGL